MIRTILKSLLKADAYPEPTNSVEMQQTHVSWIFLTDNHAYKIKKPVDFGFLNFSTIDRRRFYCNEEVRLNRRLCPDTYEGVVELRESPNGGAFHGNGQIIDYAVKMKRLPAERMLDRLVENNMVTSAEMRTVASAIADFHRNAGTSHAISEYGQLDRIMFNWDENFDQMIPFADATLPTEDRVLIRDWITGFAAGNGELFKRRVAEGYIRECDGDIHLENICLVDGRICIFDCIEFNERFRCCDTAADVAFLLMDLDFHGRHDLAEDVVDTYLKTSGDGEMMALIDFYKVYRAFVRGKVESLRMNDGDIEQQGRELAKSRSIRYFRLARGYIERRRLRPVLFITCGLMGCGKSSLAAQLSFELGINSFNSDTVRKQLAGMAPGTQAPSAYGEGLYASKASEATYARLRCLAEAELAAGRSLIIDASFKQRSERGRCADLARQYGATLGILHITCSEDEILRRLTDRADSGSSVSDGRPELLERQRHEFETPAEDEGVLIQLTSSAPPATMTNSIYTRLNRT